MVLFMSMTVKRILKINNSWTELFNFQNSFKVPIAPNYKDVCLQNTSKSHSYHLKI